MKVILDTNFIMELIKNKVDIDDVKKYGGVVVPRQVFIELEKISVEGESRDRRVAEIAIKILEKSSVEIIELDKNYVDLGIEIYAEKHPIILASMDQSLKKRLKGKARFLELKAGKKLVL
jgi:rRNA-processing protein FCF1